MPLSLLSFLDSIMQSIFSPLYLFELLFLTTFQLKLWYFAGSLPDVLGRIADNDAEVGTITILRYLLNVITSVYSFTQREF